MLGGSPTKTNSIGVEEIVTRLDEVVDVDDHARPPRSSRWSCRRCVWEQGEDKGQGLGLGRLLVSPVKEENGGDVGHR